MRPDAFAASALACLALAACGLRDGPGVQVEVEFAGAPTQLPLTDVSVIVGGDKFRWGDVPRQAPQRVTLAPGAQDDRQLTLMFRLDGAAKVWEGPKLPAGTAYKLRAVIGPDGSVSERHCLVPCTL